MRKGDIKKRTIAPDRKYNSIHINKLIKCVMLNGKITLAERIVYTALENVALKHSKTVLEIWDLAMENIKPKRHVGVKKFGGNVYLVPKEIKTENRILFAIKLLIKAMRKEAWKSGKTTTVILEHILNQSLSNSGPAVSAKEELHKKAEANAAFSHFQ
jgi:small subunit ribosomal protein S7